MANWSFSCPHPKGGMIRIDIQINEYGDIFLLKWWFYEPNGHYKSEDAWELDQSVWVVVAAIKRAILIVSDWHIGDWNDRRSKGEINLVAEIEFCLHDDALIGAPAWYSGVRPQHRIPGRPKSFFGQIDLLGVESILPGQCCKAKASCIIAEQDRPFFVAGFCWHICTKDRVIGYARYVSTYSC